MNGFNIASVPRKAGPTAPPESSKSLFGPIRILFSPHVEAEGMHFQPLNHAQLLDPGKTTGVITEEPPKRRCTAMEER